MGKRAFSEQPRHEAPEIPSQSQGRKRFQEYATPLLPVLVLSAQGSILHLSPPARLQMELCAQQPVRSSFFSYVHGRNLHQVMRDVAEMVRYGKKRVSWLLRLRTGKGRWRWFRATVMNRLDGPDAVLVVFLRDL